MTGVFDHIVRHGHCVMRLHNTEMNRYVEGEVRQSRIRSVEAEFVMDKMEGRGEASTEKRLLKIVNAFIRLSLTMVMCCSATSLLEFFMASPEQLTRTERFFICVVITMVFHVVSPGSFVQVA